MIFFPWITSISFWWSSSIFPMPFVAAIFFYWYYLPIYFIWVWMFFPINAIFLFFILFWINKKTLWWKKIINIASFFILVFLSYICLAFFYTKWDFYVMASKLPLPINIKIHSFITYGFDSFNLTKIDKCYTKWIKNIYSKNNW